VHGRIYQTIDDVRDAVRSSSPATTPNYTRPTHARVAWREAAFRHAA
jgi:hypothetical protein